MRDIDEFEEAIGRLLHYKDEDGIGWLREGLEMFVHMDGCLGARYNGVLIPCERRSWRESLDVILKYIEYNREE